MFDAFIAFLRGQFIVMLCLGTIYSVGLSLAGLNTAVLIGMLAGLVLDLRNNPGGVLDAAVDVSDLFLDSGIIVSAEGRTHDSRFRRSAHRGDILDGADLIVHSTTKYFDGHNATVGGAVISKTEELQEKIKFIQNSTGSIMSPMVAWLTLQGVKTLSERMDRQSDNAMRVARFLATHPKVVKVAYPGLESFPQHDLAKQQASGFGAMAWFEVEGGVAAGKKLMDFVELWTLAENLGSVESLITHPVTMTHAAIEPEERLKVGITDGLVRISVGIEHIDDLIWDLEQALEKVEVPDAVMQR